MAGIGQALEGRRHVPIPEGWAIAYAKLVASSDTSVRERARAQAVQFGDKAALATVRQLVFRTYGSSPLSERSSALRVLLDQKDPELLPMLQKLLDHPELRGPAIRGLAAYEDPTTPETAA